MGVGIAGVQTVAWCVLCDCVWLRGWGCWCLIMCCSICWVITTVTETVMCVGWVCRFYSASLVLIKAVHSHVVYGARICIIAKPGLPAHPSHAARHSIEGQKGKNYASL